MSSKIPTSSEAEGQKSLEEDCGWVSSIFMLYLDRLFAKGNVKSLESEDLGHISQRDRTELLVARFRENYDEYVSGRERGTLTSLWHPLLKTVSLEHSSHSSYPSHSSLHHLPSTVLYLFEQLIGDVYFIDGYFSFLLLFVADWVWKFCHGNINVFHFSSPWFWSSSSYESLGEAF
jgi:hypothetical protein